MKHCVWCEKEIIEGWPAGRWKLADDHGGNLDPYLCEGMNERLKASSRRHHPMSRRQEENPLFRLFGIEKP